MRDGFAPVSTLDGLISCPMSLFLGGLDDIAPEIPLRVAHLGDDPIDLTTHEVAALIRVAPISRDPSELLILGHTCT